MTREIAQQIARLLNERNKLQNVYTVEKILENKNNYPYILNSEGILVGAVEIKCVQWYQYELLHLTVSETFEGKDYARVLIDMAEERAKDNNARIIQCTISSENKRSKKMFSKNGYKNVSTFHNEITGNNVEVWQKIVCPAKSE